VADAPHIVLIRSCHSVTPSEGIDSHVFIMVSFARVPSSVLRLIAKIALGAKMAAKGITEALRKNVRAYAKAHREVAKLSAKLDAIELIFREIEKEPSRYTHVVHKGKARESSPMTKGLIRKLKRQMLQQQQPPKNPHGGPGCDDCDDIEGCWCAFKAGPLCCYVCASPAVIQCYF
jgi:hypothetical protein